MDYTKDHKNRVNSLLMEKWGYGKKDEAIEVAEELEELPAEEEPVEEPVAEPEAAFGKSKVGGQEFKKASVATGKQAGSGGFTDRERGVVGDLQKKMVGAAEEGDIVTGKAMKLAKLFAAELDALIAKGK